MNLHQAWAEIHRRHALPAPPGMHEPTAALHHAECALRAGRRYPGWQAARQRARGARRRLGGRGRQRARLRPCARGDSGHEAGAGAARPAVAHAGAAAQRRRRAAGGRRGPVASGLPGRRAPPPGLFTPRSSRCCSCSRAATPTRRSRSRSRSATRPSSGTSSRSTPSSRSARADTPWAGRGARRRRVRDLRSLRRRGHFRLSPGARSVRASRLP